MDGKRAEKNRVKELLLSEKNDSNGHPKPLFRRFFGSGISYISELRFSIFRRYK